MKEKIYIKKSLILQFFCEEQYVNPAGVDLRSVSIARSLFAPVVYRELQWCPKRVGIQLV
jgi:hypothetical protein